MYLKTGQNDLKSLKVHFLYNNFTNTLKNNDLAVIIIAIIFKKYLERDV